MKAKSMSFEPFLALEASAGSGKTFALSLRFCALILKGANINEILALTFTKKAANEMKARIINNFLSFEKEEALYKNLQALLEKKGIKPSLEELIAIRDARKSDFLRSNLHIYTFDSFFVRIIRAFCLNLGLLPDFKLTNSIDLKLDFIKSLKDTELNSLARYLCNTGESKKRFFKALEYLHSSLIKKPSLKASLPDKSLVMDAYKKLSQKSLKYSKNINFLKNFNATCLEEIVKKPLVRNIKANYFENLDEDFYKEVEHFHHILNKYFDELEAYQVKNYLDFLKLYEKARLEINKKENLLSFQDSTRYSYELLGKDMDKDLIYFRLDSKITHLLIDEFQDTNIFQYKILKPIISELVAGLGVRYNKSFFYVGDVKQSIYRFRGAKKELFYDLQADFPQINKSYLDTNYRSAKNIVAFVNKHFSPVMSSYIEQKSIKDGGYVEVCCLEESAKNKKDFSLLFKDELLKKLQKLFDKNILEEEICILCQTNEDAKMLRDYLLASKINAYTDSNLLLSEFAKPRLVIEYAKYLLFADLFSLQLLKEYLGKNPAKFKLDLRDSPTQIALFLARALKLDLSDLNLIAYLEYACEFDDFLDLLFTPCQKEAAQSKELGICVMTVHKSKGLEFEHLIVVDDFSKKKKIDENKLKIEYEKGAFILCMEDKARAFLKNKEYIDFFERKERLDLEDKLNQQYVAFTRAKQALIIIKKQESLLFDPLKLQTCVIGEIKPKKKLEKIKKSLEYEASLDTSSYKIKENIEKKEPKKYHFGLALHELLENIDFKKPNFALEERAIYNKYQLFLSPNSLEDIFLRAKKLLNYQPFLKLIEAKELLKEQPLIYKGERKQLDLLALSEDEALIFDYKSAQSLEHEAQLSLYKEAIAKITGKKTSAYVLYLLEKELKMIKL